MIKKTVDITDEHDEWLEENAINFSKWVRQRLNETMESITFRKDQGKSGDLEESNQIFGFEEKVEISKDDPAVMPRFLAQNILGESENGDS